MKTKQIIGIVVAGLVFIMVGMTGFLTDVLKNKMNDSKKASTDAQTSMIDTLLSNQKEKKLKLPSEDFVGVINIVGTIQGSDSSSTISKNQYDHTLYMEYIDKMEKSSSNKGILLYVDSPGGAVFQSDELYLKLMEYKEKTKRPVYAYFATEACSGAYYISMAADKIYANRNCWTGSIGVIVSLTNYEKLYKKLGLKEIDITSGKNKAMGSGGLKLTKEQQGILQGLVDEAYDQFTGIVSDGRKLDLATVKKLADGRIYSAKQAKEKKLIDELGSEDDAKKSLESAIGCNSNITYYEPPQDISNILSSLLNEAKNLKPASQTDLINDLVKNKGNGVLMYYAK